MRAAGRFGAGCTQNHGSLLNTDVLALPAASLKGHWVGPEETLPARGALETPLLQKPPSPTTGAPPGACRSHSCEKQGARSQPLTEPLNSCGLTGRAGGTGGSNGQRGGGTWCQLPNTHSACHSAVTLGILVTNRTG